MREAIRASAFRTYAEERPLAETLGLPEGTVPLASRRPPISARCVRRTTTPG
jgi:hypothetical protein